MVSKYTFSQFRVTCEKCGRPNTTYGKHQSIAWTEAVCYEPLLNRKHFPLCSPHSVAAALLRAPTPSSQKRSCHASKTSLSVRLCNCFLLVCIHTGRPWFNFTEKKHVSSTVPEKVKCCTFFSYIHQTPRESP